MKIEIKEQNYKQLVQCVYLGNLIINGYRKESEIKSEYSDFAEGIYAQLVKADLRKQSNFKFKVLPDEKSEEAMLADLNDRIYDSVKEDYGEYRQALLCEMLADVIADRNYPVIGNSEADALDNLIAKNLYCELLKDGIEKFLHIDAPKIDDKIKRAKRG